MDKEITISLEADGEVTFQLAKGSMKTGTTNYGQSVTVLLMKDGTLRCRSANKKFYKPVDIPAETVEKSNMVYMYLDNVPC